MDNSHLHIVGVRCDDGIYRNNRQVKESIERGERWYSTAGENQIPINWVRWCPGMNCGMGPYLVSTGSFQEHAGTGLKIKLRPSTPDSLENLPHEDALPNAATPVPTQGVGAATGG